ncbi:hypothetical protein K490DRAFT_60360 [Saccharata proteae CBS 121410]|uniref:Uncharacterized protein n=1 Tax=Saccharata proteae CBS 121410 TaxID=1314787 RepID=A0A9P4HML4_9PEZI|nr:hypothetical protein K490DRAFT_60360 [Saccharata proteae CBS 121410]
MAFSSDVTPLDKAADVVRLIFPCCFPRKRRSLKIEAPTDFRRLSIKLEALSPEHQSFLRDKAAIEALPMSTTTLTSARPISPMPSALPTSPRLQRVREKTRRISSSLSNTVRRGFVRPSSPDPFLDGSDGESPKMKIGRREGASGGFELQVVTGGSVRSRDSVTLGGEESEDGEKEGRRER